MGVCLTALCSGKATGVTMRSQKPTEGPCTLRMNSSAYVAWCGTRSVSLHNPCGGHSSCCTRRAFRTTWQTIVRSVSSVTRRSCSLPSWRVDWWRCWRTNYIYRIPKLDSSRLENAETTCVHSDGSLTRSSMKTGKLSSTASTTVLRLTRRAMHLFRDCALAEIGVSSKAADCPGHIRRRNS